MIKYIKIVNYMSGDSISKQIQNIIDNGMMDEDTRLFFDITNNDEINNVVFVPKDYFIERFVENGESFEYKKY